MWKTSRRGVARRLLRLSILVGIPLAAIPVLVQRRVAAKRPAAHAVRSRRHVETALAIATRLQAIVDEHRQRLGIAEPVMVTLVAANPLVVSVERSRDREGAFSMLLEEDFVRGLSDQELAAVSAHELGHVWIFTHHPFLHTEELANEVALRVVGRAHLDAVYDKVWTRAGPRGPLVYLPDR